MEGTRAWDHPAEYVRSDLGCNLWSKQGEILKAVRKSKRVAVRSCNGSGKTYAAACAVVWWLMSFRDSAIAITTAPTERQVKDLLWREIRRIHAANSALVGGTASHTALEISARRYAKGFSTDAPERFQGFHDANILFVVDEASGVDEDIYEAIEGSMTTGGARLLLIGNPTRRQGTFYDAFNSRRSLWHTMHISAFDTPNFKGSGGAPGLVTAEWVEDARRNWGESNPLYQVRVLGQFPDSSHDSLVPLSLIERAVYGA